MGWCGTLARRASVTAGHHAAIHIPDCAGDPARLVRKQEDDGLGHIARGAHAADRVEAVKALQRAVDFRLGDKAFVDRRLDHRGRYRVDTDTPGGEFHRKMLRQRVQAGLGHRVSGRRRRGDGLLCPHRADVDDRSRALGGNQVGGDLLRHEEERLVQLHVLVVIRILMIEEGLREEHACGVDQQIDVPMRFVDGLQKGSQPGVARQVGSQRPHVAEGGQFLARFLGLLRTVADDDGTTTLGQHHVRRFEAHAARAANHQNLLACKFVAHIASLHSKSVKTLEVEENLHRSRPGTGLGSSVSRTLHVGDSWRYRARGQTR
ncbi:hypothetical protein CBM2633_A40467 [Cupriavidus taiwanensis]|nr:hypothetical protein CBM2633_A40467 [Cupriavidus taiwanensis]